MAADLQALNEDVAFPPELRVERGGDEGTLSEFVEVARAGFELPEFTAWYIFEACRAVGLAEGSPVRNYGGRIDGAAVATASVALAAGVAGVYNVATLPKARRRGVGAAMTLNALREARALGYRIGTLTSSAIGFGVYRRLGFERYGTYSTYVAAEGA